jgi:hypothetical protein
MKLEEGKKYILRNGELTGRMVKYPPNYLFSYHDPITSEGYNEDGSYWDSSIIDERDIIREYKKK